MLVKDLRHYSSVTGSAVTAHSDPVRQRQEPNNQQRPHSSTDNKPIVESMSVHSPKRSLVRRLTTAFSTYGQTPSLHGHKHRAFEVYAGIMFFLYPVGIPLLYAVLLFQRRHVLAH